MAKQKPADEREKKIYKKRTEGENRKTKENEKLLTYEKNNEGKAKK